MIRNSAMIVAKSAAAPDRITENLWKVRAPAIG
jgi:hypothetical protein